MPPRWHLLRRLYALGPVAIVIAGCLSPTLPLPPPDEPNTITSSEEGIWLVGGDCIAGAEVVVMNEETGRGEVFLDLDRKGRYSVAIEGEACDVIVISQSLSTEESAEVRVTLEEVADGVEVNPDACP
ncbi:MAG: hypothetical protein HOW73_33660 [Polyangiaceae bacterium]|nr:hypothetical protein [Polyangiaceae bacterium]